MTRFKATTRREFLGLTMGAGLWLAGAEGAWAQDATTITTTTSSAPSVAINDQIATLMNGDYGAAINLANGHVKINASGTIYLVRLSINTDGTAPEPSAATTPPLVTSDSDSAVISVTYPLPNDQALTISLSAYHDAPGIFLMSRVKNLGKFRQYYCYWYWDGTYTSVFAPQEGSIVERHPDLTTLDKFGYNDWLYLPEQSGGLVAITKQILGRGSQADKTTYLFGAPSNQFLGNGQSMDIGIGFAHADTPADAQKLYSVLAAKAIPALNASAQVPNMESIDYGQPAPDWVRGTSKYNCWPTVGGNAPASWMQADLAHYMHPFRFLSHVPNDVTIIDNCHKGGVRVVMYLNFMEMLNSAIQTEAGDKGAWYLNDNWGKIVDHENMDLSKHLNWVSYDDKGNARQSGWGAANNIPGLFNTCLHQTDLHDAVVQQTKDILALGVDGIFIDNAGGIPDCYGDKFSKHAHAFPSLTNTAAYDVLMKRVYSTVKSVGNDKILVLNSGINPNQWSYCDAQMWEACLYGSGVVAKTSTWEDAQYAGEMHADAIRHGKVPIILSYFDDQPIATRNDRVLYTYAYARLYDLGWGDWFTMIGKDGDVKDAYDLYSTQLGMGAGDVVAADRVFSRLFEHGVAVVNPDLWSKKATVSLPRNGTLYDVCHDNTISAESNTVTVEMAPESGRILIWR